MSVGTTSSTSNLYEKPEQPPDSTLSRSRGESGVTSWMRCTRARARSRTRADAEGGLRSGGRRAAVAANLRALRCEVDAGRRVRGQPSVAPEQRRPRRRPRHRPRRYPRHRPPQPPRRTRGRQHPQPPQPLDAIAEEERASVDSLARAGSHRRWALDHPRVGLSRLHRPKHPWGLPGQLGTPPTR